MIMKWPSLLVIVLLGLSSTTAAEPAPARKGLAVHEWGVFRVNENAEFANADLRAEWDELPEFVYGHIKGRVVPQHWGAVEIRRKPIIFFHADAPVQVQVKVDFPGGQAGVWYPATVSPAVFGVQKQPKTGSSLVWDLGVKQCPDGWRPKQPNPPAVSDRHWISRIRQVHADDIFSHYSPNNLDVEREKFIYYDGIFPQKKWLKITVANDRVALTSQVRHPVFDVTVVDRRDGKVRVGRVAKLGAGESVEEVKFTQADAAVFASDASAALVKQLTTAGLFEDEAQSLADLWKREFFETPGLNLFYRLPQEEYDRCLPLTLTPKPESTVRTGLVYHAHLEPDFEKRIMELVKQLDSARFAERDAAMKKLFAIGPAALVQIQKLRQGKDLSAEVQSRLDALVKKWSAREGFDGGDDEPKQ